MARAKRGVNIRQFAERRGCNVRAVYRDIETLREAGVPVDHPEHGWFSVPEHWLPSGTVDVRPEELTALWVARQLAPGLKGTAIGRALDNLGSKLSTPGHQPQLPLGDETWFHTGAPTAIDYGPHQIVLDTVREAVQTRRALRIHYRKPGSEPSVRTIEPAFVHWDAEEQALYVYAWCRKRDALRMFAIHRIERAELTSDLFAPRREAVTEMSKAYRLWPRGKAERVVLRFSPRVAGEIRERRWHRTAQLTDTDDGGVVLEMEVGAPEELERRLLGYGADVVIEAPAALAERVRERHAEAAGPAHFGILRARPAERPAETVAPQWTCPKP
ncbi:MAG TPA: transcriptional regulator [Kofleriaceae bacterium]